MNRVGYRKRRNRLFETLEKRVLLAGDLVAQWRAEDLSASLSNEANVATWDDAIGGVTATPDGQPVWIQNAIGGRAAIRFDASDGIDGLRVGANVSPMSGAEDFSVTVTFVTSSVNLQGGQGDWYKNSGLVDANILGAGKDWGLTINAEGAVSAGMGVQLFSPSETVYSDVNSLNDGGLHLVTWTRSGADLTLYVDGVAAGSSSMADAAARVNLDMMFGRTANGSFGFTGDIAEIQIHNGELSAAEVSETHSALNTFYNNAPPQAVADQYEFTEDDSFFDQLVPAALGVLVNDDDADGDTLTAVLVEDAQHGSLSLRADGSFIYDSEPDYFGPDSFAYVARDFRNSDPVTVSLNVQPAYDPAQAVADRYKVLSGTSLIVATADGLHVNDVNPDQVQLTTVLDQDVSSGRLTLAPDGSFVYDPQGFTGHAVFSYKLDDGTGLSNAVEVTLVVNSPPLAADDSFLTSEDVPLNLNSAQGVTVNDTDAEGDALVATLISPTEHGEILLQGDGSFVYTPEPNYVGSDTFSYQLSDGEDVSNTATASIRVDAVNDAPDTANDVYFGLADRLLTVGVAGGVLANDTDVEGQPLTARLVTPPAQGTLNLSADGSFTYEPPAGFTGVATFAYSADDGQDSSVPTGVQIAINSLEQQQQIVINEVHTDPPLKTDLVEFIELHNTGDVPINLSGWTLRGAVDFTFPSGASVGPGGYAVATMDTVEFEAKFATSAFGPWSGRLTNSGETIELWTAGGAPIDEVDYQLGFPWPVVGEPIEGEADDVGPSMQLINPHLANDLGGSWRSAKPTPGARNAAFSLNAAPQVRRVNHSPVQPSSTDAVTITALVTDPQGVRSVTLDYQSVNPGDYISLTDARYQTEWTTLAMHDDGQNGDETANDGLYSVVLPSELQTHRRLVRYRMSATDQQALSVSVPYADDPQPNFAYFVYDGVPDWTGSPRPGQQPDVTYGSELLESVPVYHLITTQESHVDSQFIPNSSSRSKYTGSDYRWEGTMVYDGEVYDHVNYRARGGVWRYAMGKNMWKFDFQRSHRFQARDDYGNEYDTKWDKLNFSSLIQQGSFEHRGEQGLFESVGFKLFNLAGTESPNTNYVHFRIIESEDENGADQYGGDFQGMYLSIEQPDGRFLDEHDLPDGNFYKIEGNNPESVTNQGPYQVDDRSDAREFIGNFRGARDRPEVEWWQENLDLEKYYGYQAISHAIHHYDTAFGKNFFYYNNPETGKWEIHPWDLDLTWDNQMFGNENHEFNVKVAKNDEFNDYVNQANIDLNNRLNHEYQNRTREILDLLYNPEQTGMLIDEMAAFVYQPGEVSFVDADRAKWDYNPIIATSTRYTDNSKNGTRYHYYDVADTGDYAGMIQILKDYIGDRTDFINSRILTNEENIPSTPTASYSGAPGFAVNDLAFQTTGFLSPIGAEFAGMEWRLAEITDPSAPGFDAYNTTEPRKYEIDATWVSGELDAFADAMTIPSHLVEPGKTYRVRVRLRDNDNHWSHWSEPVQFAATAAVSTELANSLRVSEVNYNPGAPTSAERAAGHDSNEDFEFIEFVNTGSSTLDLSGASLIRLETEDGLQGVDFDFAGGEVTQLAPGQRVVVVEDLAAFQARYGDQVPTAGQWNGRLSNDSELITVSAFGTVIQEFSYNDQWYAQTDGQGMTLETVDPGQPDLGKWNVMEGWKASGTVGGTPGTVAGIRIAGDANGDGRFDSADLVLVVQAGKFEDGIAQNATFEEGDWNGDGDFDSADLVFVFQAGNYVAVAPVAAAGQVTHRMRASLFESTGEKKVKRLHPSQDLSAVDQVFGDGAFGDGAFGDGAFGDGAFGDGAFGEL